MSIQKYETHHPWAMQLGRCICTDTYKQQRPAYTVCNKLNIVHSEMLKQREKKGKGRKEKERKGHVAAKKVQC